VARLDEARPHRNRLHDRKPADDADVPQFPAFLLRPIRVKA
jgi:hypothetical protein